MMKYRLLLISTLLSPFFTFAQETVEKGLDETVNDAFMPFATWWENTVLTAVPIAGYDIPIVLILLIVGATFFTIYFKFPGITKFPLGSIETDFQNGSRPSKFP